MSFDQPYFFSHAKEQLAWAGHTPGLPWPFQYVEVPVNVNYVNPEYVPSPLLPTTGVFQTGRQNPIIGHFDSMVYDVPFDTAKNLRVDPPSLGHNMWWNG